MKLGQDTKVIERAREFSFSDQDFGEIVNMLKEWAGISLPDTKKSLVYSRLAKRLRILSLPSFKSYCQFVSSDAGLAERDHMLSALTTNVTSFFREDHHFETMRTEIFPHLIQKAKNGGRVRIWSAGCSSGQEPYSIAFTLLDACPDAGSLDIRILATDIDRSILKIAQDATYERDLTDPISASYRERFFVESKTDENCLKVSEKARNLISFRQLNLMENWPFSGPFDIIICRNVAIYFDRGTQQTLWSRFSELLTGDGTLFIGHSERVSGPALGTLSNTGVTTYQKRSS